MRISLKAMALAGGVLWGAAILLVGLLHLAHPAYGLGFLQMTSSVYPGFHASHSLLSVFIGTVEGFVDGAVAAILFAVLYNSFVPHAPHLPHTV
jgi:hypothetical protein